MIRLMCQKELLLIKLMVQVSVLLFITGTILRYKTKICYGCPDLMQKAIKFNDIAIVSIKRNGYRINFWCISMDEAIS